MASTDLRFRSLPLAVRLATMLAFFLAWVLFAELIIDRHGLDTYLPFYRVGNFLPLRCRDPVDPRLQLVAVALTPMMATAQLH